MSWGIKHKNGEYFSGWYEIQEPIWTNNKSDAQRFGSKLHAETQALLLANFHDEDTQRKAVKL